MKQLDRKSVQSIVVLAVFIAGLCLGGCGFKDKPVPPSRVVPRAVTDLSYQFTDNGVVLFWTYPKETVTGDDLAEISSFDLYRAVVPAEDYCETCPIPFGAPISLPGGALPEKGARTGNHEDTLLRPGNFYLFKIKSKSGWWTESEDSNVVSFLWNSPPLVPEGLKVKPGDGKNALSWQPVTTHKNGTPLTEAVKYQVYRNVNGAGFKKIGEPVKTTGYSDIQVENGKQYEYQVQAISEYKQGKVAGAVSEAVAANPIDRTAPPTPAEVKGIRTDAGVKVFWNSSVASDLAGYRIYRRTEGESQAKLVGEVKAPNAFFLDKKTPQDGGQLFYSVSSVDQQKPANESARSPEVVIAF